MPSSSTWPRPLLCVALLVTSSACQAADPPPVVTVAQLSADPQAYDGRVVTLTGFLGLEEDSYNVWATDVAMYDLDRNACVSLKRWPRDPKVRQRLDAEWGSVTGIFTADARVKGGRRIIRFGACSDMAIDIAEVADIRLVEHR